MQVVFAKAMSSKGQGNLSRAQLIKYEYTGAQETTFLVGYYLRGQFPGVKERVTCVTV